MRCLTTEYRELQEAWRSMPSSARKDFIHERTRYVQERKNFAVMGSKWETDYKEKCRLDTILQRLREAGWTEELEALSPETLSNGLPSKTGGQNSTAAWSRIEASLQCLLQRVREERLYSQRYTLMCPIVDERSHHYKGVFPSCVEFASDPLVQTLLTDHSSNNLTHAEFQNAIRLHIKPIRERWEEQIRVQIDSGIRYITRRHYSGRPTGLAIGALMRCSSCRIVQEYPNLLSHQCSPPVWEQKPPHMHALGYLVAFRYAIWDYRFTQILQHVIAACGEDPSTARVDEMDASDARLYCTHCVRRMPGVLNVLSWREAVVHPYIAHKDEPVDFTLEGITWGRVPIEQCTTARLLESSLAAELREKCHVSPEWQCALCSVNPDSRSSCMAHLQSEHLSVLSEEGISADVAVEKHAYRSPHAEVHLTGRGVYLISDKLTFGDICAQMSSDDAFELTHSIESGKATFCSLPEEYLGEEASQTALNMYFDDLQKNSRSSGCPDSSDLPVFTTLSATGAFCNPPQYAGPQVSSLAFRTDL
ncbi:hypothetical protein EIP91_007108 [Steccherinum ochraceum]|uniref:Uncharacterized protein n=1 Tax=Steccherinum ochraceum TaxID=92696 RepID=A0A4R0RCX5_9APHY|nr:hypothetical protein EIP91_007108 [Steccherinum ochraceum]